MAERKLVIGCYGNGKSTNRYHIPFLMRRKDRITVKTIYARTLRDDWARWDGVNYTDNLDDLLGEPDRITYDVRQLLGEGRMNDYFDLDFFYDKGTDQYDVMPGGLKVSIKSSYFRAKERPSFVVYGRRGMFVKAEKDKQEADLKKFYLPDHADFGLDTPANFGTLTYYDEDGHYHEESVETVEGDNGRFYDALYETVINGAPPLVTEAQTMAQMRILAKATEGLK